VFISVVIATYKRPQLLVRCLTALQLQTMPASLFEVMIVSDGPDPVTCNAIKTFCSQNRMQVRYLALPCHTGPAAARNRGWQAAEGDIIIFTDDDCKPAPDFLKAYYSYYTDHCSTSVAFSGRTIVPVPTTPYGQLTDAAINLKGLEQARFITANCAVRRVDLMKVGGLDSTYTMAWREDSDLEFTLRSRGTDIKKAHSAVVYHPLRKAKWGSSLHEQKKSMFNALLFKKFPKQYKREIQSAPPFIYYSYLLASISVIISLMGVVPLPVQMGLILFWWAIFGYIFTVRWLPVHKTWANSAELLATSLFIPILSIYWRIRGALRFKVFFL